MNIIKGAHLYYYLAFVYILIALFCVDFLVRITMKYARNLEYFKPISLLMNIALVYTNNPKYLVDKENSLKRFLLSAIMCIAMILLIIIHFTSEPEGTLKHVLMVTAPIIASPFYHLYFGLASNHPLCLHAAVSGFKKRILIALIVSGNLIFITLLGLEQHEALALHWLLVALALCYSFYLLTTKRLPESPENLYVIEDADQGAASLFHYLACLLEYGLVCLLVAKVCFLQVHLERESVKLFYVGFLIGISILLAASTRYFFYKKRPWPEEVLEELLLPLSFLLFGANFLQGSYYF